MDISLTNLKTIYLDRERLELSNDTIYRSITLIISPMQLIKYLLLLFGFDVPYAKAAA